jgi:putative ABC transport system permease protein
MFFFTYLAKELRRRLRQAIFIALGLAVGVGLVLTVKAASAGVTNAQSAVLAGLYGVGTDITVAGAAPKPPSGTTAPGGGGNSTQIMMGPNGAEMCTNGKCHSLKDGYTIDNLGIVDSSPISESDVAKIAALRGVTAAVGGLSMTDNQITISTTGGGPPVSFTVFGTDVTALKLGPISNAVLTSGRTFTASDADKDVAVVDADYATANDLKVGKTIKVGGVKFTVIGLVSQAEGSSPPNVYIPLARAQALGATGVTKSGTLKGDVNTIYVAAASAADISSLQSEIAKVVPTATITTPSSLAKEITGSVSSAAKLANDLGKWLSILVLIAAFVVAVLLTISAVSRRVREFGTLKALGWRGGRIVAQVMGESLAVGVAGAALGVGIGYAGAAIINAIAPRLSGTLPSQSTGQQIMQSTNGVTHVINPATAQTVSVPLIASVGGAAILLAVLLALAGGLLAGVFGSWRIGRLRPADALSKVG